MTGSIERMSLDPQASAADTGSPRPPTGIATDELPQARLGRENRRWWIKVFLQPVLFLVFGALLIIALGVAQRMGWITATQGGDHSHAFVEGEGVSYICPMMCTPPLAEPGRCPVCAMELVPSTSAATKTDSLAVWIEPAARRVANIRTVAAQSMPLMRTLRAVGELGYNEGSLKTISAYVDGRLERLYADYTGVEVQKDDPLALVYSPKLYTAQVEYLLAKAAFKALQPTATKRPAPSNLDLSETSRQRLIELGMTHPQIEELEREGRANSRLNLYAPNSGTVIEKLAVEGQYVNEGEPIYKLADLSTVWLMLKLFPEDAASMRYGQKVRAQMQSLPGREFAGRVAFIDPMVDPETRTVGVRVVIPNDDGLLRVGDYATATIEIPMGGHDDLPRKVFDPELARQWISPRHPHVIASSPGFCRECGVALVPAEQLGFTDDPGTQSQVLVVPRDAVLMAAQNSVLYVETEPGRFEIRQVVLGPSVGDEIVILSGIREGEQVASRGNFLIDSQMQLAGNPSLIDPTKAMPKMDGPESEETMLALAGLSARDRQEAINQRICPVTKMALGSMGAPPKVDVDGTSIFICCEGCRATLLNQPGRYLNKPDAGRKRNTTTLHEANKGARSLETPATADGPPSHEDH